MNHNGRQKIQTNYTLEEIESDLLVLQEVLSNAEQKFTSNVSDIDYLFNYFAGEQPILERTKTVREEINNKIVVNYANAIVKFKTGYLLWKPIQYIARKEGVEANDLVVLNDYMVMQEKASKDKEIADWQSICGTAYRMGLQNEVYEEDMDDVPFEVRNIHPKNAFVVYSADTGDALLGVVVLRDVNAGDQITKYQIYSKTKYWVYNTQTQLFEEQTTHTYGQIPLIEYPLNEQRIGDFEIVLSLLDAINLTQSNRLDGVEQFIQSLLVFKNIEIDADMLKQLKDLGAINIKQNGEIEANVEYLSQELNQEQTETLISSLWKQVETICGMPSKNNSGGAGSNTGTAVIVANGWSEAETRANDVELVFTASERKFLKLVLYITRTMTQNKLNLRLGDIDIKFTRRNYENVYQKAQVLDLLLKNPKVAPRLAFEVCGLFQDVETAYQESADYYENAKNESEKIAQPINKASEEINNG